VRVANSEDFTTKSGRERTVPLVGEALDALRRRSAMRRTESPSEFVFPGAGGEMLSGHYLSKRFRAFVSAARLRDADAHNFHSLRHTFGTWAVSRGVDVYRLKEIMGHARIETTLQYARLRPVTLFSEMERAFGGGLLPHREGAPAAPSQA
jgi:integrase